MSSHHHYKTDDMTFPKKALAAVVLLALVGTLFLWRDNPKPTTVEIPAPTAAIPAATPSPARSDAPASLPTQSAKQLPQNRPAVPASLTDQRTAIATEFQTAKSLKAFYDKYSRAEFASNGAAAYFRARALADCGTWHKADPDRFSAVMNGPDYKTNPAVQDRVRATFAYAEECRGLSEAEDGKTTRLLFEQSAALKDPAGIARLLADIDRGGQKDEAVSIAQQLLRNPNADVVHGLIAYFGQRADPWTIGDGVYTRELSADAWRLAACNWGGDCGPSNRDIRVACIAENNCQAQTFSEYLQQYRYPPADFATLQRLSNTITSSVATQNWAALGLTIKGDRGGGK
jgi:hypothetical protein